MRSKSLGYLAGIAVLASACGGSSGSVAHFDRGHSKYLPDNGTAGGKLTYSDWQPVNDLNGFNASAATTTQVTNLLWDYLWIFDPNNQAIPVLVREVPSVENGDVKVIDSKRMDITINLREGLKWSDGHDLTVDDVKYTVDASCDPDSGGNTVGYDHIASTEIKSKTQMIWHFAPEPTKSTTDSAGKQAYRCGLTDKLDSGIYAPYLLLTLQPMPKHILGKVAHKDFATTPYFTQKPTVVSGPYQVQNFTPGASAQVVLTPNPHHGDGRSGAPFFGHKAYLDQLIYKIYGDKSSQIAGLRSGDTDLGLDLIAKDLPVLQTITQDKTEYVSSLLTEHLNLNTGNNTKGCDSKKFEPTCGTGTVFKDDQVLRQAIQLAVDKDAIVQNLVAGIGTTMNSPFPHTFEPWYDTSKPKFQRDVATANSMLDQDGWVKGKDGIRAKAGRKLAWNISTTAGNPQRAAEEEVLIKNWKEIGATVTPANFPAGNFFAPFQNGGILSTGQYDMALYANFYAPDPDSWGAGTQISQLPSPTNSGGSNWGRWNDPIMDKLSKDGETTVDPKKRLDIYRQFQAEWVTYVGQIDLYERPDVFTHANSFGNFSANGGLMGGAWNGADWYFKKGAQ